MSDAKNTRKIDAFFSKQKSGERWELQVGEQSESSPSSSNTMIEVVEQGEVGHQHQRPQPKVQLLMLPSLKLGFINVYLHYV